jgi:hypothetical protein
MKAIQFQSIISELAAMFSELGLEDVSRRMSLIAKGFDHAPSLSMMQFVEAAKPLLNDHSDGEQPTIGDVLRDFGRIAPLIAVISKAPFLADFKLWLRSLANAENMSIRAYIEALGRAFEPTEPKPHVGESLVEAYARRLTETQHDASQFPAVYGHLEADKRLTKSDIVDIASRFAFRMAKSTPKKEALAKIWKQHDTSETSAVKSRAMDGKSAA